MVIRRLLVHRSFALSNEVNRYLLPVVHKYDPNFIQETLPKEKLMGLSKKIQKYLI